MTQNSKGTALVTGASAGIGAAYADRLARRGHDLILVARNPERLEAVAGRLRAATTSTVRTLAADLTDATDLRRIERTLATDPTVTLLVNNAGTGVATTALDWSADELQKMIDLNVTALVRLSHAAAKAFASRGAGTIINIGSVAGIVPEILNSVYGGTKAFVLGFSQSLQSELKDSGVRVQAVMPGAIATEFWVDSGTALADLPSEIVMSVDDVVDAALAGLDLGEAVTIPSLPDIDAWNSIDAARLALRPNLSRAKPAARYTARS